ncbi:MAG TPA: amidophosphoribosyltransferase [Caldisericia bacterium]|nr:amidophosphoribosyltransferase [Caldisericia bacterium]
MLYEKGRFEMCGIIGIITKDHPVSYDLYNGLLDLQHRGQDTAGMYTETSDKVFLKKGSGLVHEIFAEDHLQEMQGEVGIAQVRYPTTIGKVDSQPFYCDYMGIAMAHNGHILNEKLVREKLAEKRVFCDSDCDAETILKLFSYYFNQFSGDLKDRCFKSIEKCMSILLGSYSVVAVIRNEGLLVFRDPHAIRPLVYGKMDQGYAFSSESIAIESLLLEPVENVLPGEAIFIDKNLNITKKLIQAKERRHCMFEWVYFSRATSRIENINVNLVRGNLGKKLAELYMESPVFGRLNQDESKIIVAAVPETSRPSAVVFSRRTGYEYKDVLEKNRFIGRIFIKPSESRRRSEVASKIKAIPEVIKDKIVLLIDDSIVRGTTSRGIVEKIRSKGAKEVHLFSTCPPLINPCHYGVDFPTREELIAYGRSMDEIAQYIGANSLFYMTPEKLYEAIGLPENSLCKACIDNQYPTPLFQEFEL